MSDPRKAARYDALRDEGKSHDEAVATIEREFSASPAPSSDPVPRRGGFLGGLARTAAQGATLGFSDEIRGLVQGAGAMLPGGRSPGEAYRSGRDAEREALARFREDHPGSALAAELLGGVVVPGVGFGHAVARGAGRATLGQIVKQGARVGGLTGTAYGAGTADEGLGDRLAGAVGGGAVGAVSGAVLPLLVRGGAAVGRRVAEKAGQSSLAPQRLQSWAAGSRAAREADQGAETLLNKLGQDDVTPEGLMEKVADARRVGIEDVAIPDLAGRNTRGLLDLAASRPGPAQQAVEQFTEGRAGGMRSMLADAFETASRIPRALTRKVREGLIQERKMKANQLFEEAFEEAGFVDDPRLISALETVEEALPNIQRKALELARLHRVPPGQLISEARVPPEIAARQLMGAAQRGTGEAIEQAYLDAMETTAGARRVPSLRYAHYVKEAIDEEIARAQQQVAKGSSGSRLAGLMQLKDGLRGAATTVSPRYGRALEEFAGDSEMLRALSLGERVFHSNVAGDDLAQAVAQMTPGEQQMFRISGLNAMRGYLEGNAALAPSITRAWWANPQMRTKMELLLGDEANTEQFLKAVSLTRNKMLTGAAGGGSQTFARSAANQELGEILGMQPGELIGAARGSLTGPAMALARRGQSALMGNRLQQVAPYLTATGGDLDRRLLELALLMNRQGRDLSGMVGQQAGAGLLPLIGNR